MKFTEKKLTLSDLVKIMFVAGGNLISGKTKVMKILFLLVEKNFSHLKEESQFFPYQYGPYSTKIAALMNKMIKNSELILEQVDNKWSINLNDKQLDNGTKIFNNLPNGIKQSVTQTVKSKNESSLKKVLFDIYTEYPEFAYNSRILSSIGASRYG